MRGSGIIPRYTTLSEALILALGERICAIMVEERL